MALCIPEIYPKLREALEQFLHDQGEWESKFAEPRGKTSEQWQKARREANTRACGLVKKFRKVTEIYLAEEDIVSMEDLAVACSRLFWNDRSWQFHDLFCSFHNHQCCYEYSSVKQVAEDLLCLLKPLPVQEDLQVGEQLLPPEGPTDVQIWETVAAAKVQQKQFCIAAVYPKKIAVQNKPSETGLQRNNFLVLAMERKFRDLVNAFEKVHLSIQADISAELHNSLTNFTARLNSCCEGMIRRMTCAPSQGVPRADLGEEMDEMTECWSRLSAQASQIAHQVAQLPVGAGAPEMNSLGSWSVVSETPRDHGMGLEGLEAEHLEVGSVASVGSQSSCLSGHGGPHCFLPSHLFKVLRSGSAAPSLVRAQD